MRKKFQSKKKIIAASSKNEDRQIDSLLRPASWDDFIGQERIKNNLKIILKAANKRKEAVDHLLFCGPAGLGKTTLACLVAKEMSATVRITSGAVLERVGDMVALLSSMEENEILFIDEIHRLNRTLEEVLYPALESRKLYVIIGKGPAARPLTLDLPPFTLVAATTRPNLLSAPLRSRFGATFRIDYYDNKDIENIIFRSADILDIKITLEAAAKLAKASRFTPRTANRLLKRARDLAEVGNHEIIDENLAEETLKFLELDNLGLESYDRRLLEIIIKKFKGGPTGLNTLAAALGEEKGVIEDIYEPFLIKTGLLYKTGSGRVASKDAYNHLKITDNRQSTTKDKY